MVTLCQRGKVLNRILRQALEAAFEKCALCKSTGQLQCKKTSLSKIFILFNEHVQVDFSYIQELGNDPCFHAVDVHTGFWAIAVQDSRHMESTAKMFEMLWINIHGTPKIASGDIEFFKAKFMDDLRYFGTTFQARPAPRHNKLGVVEWKHALDRTLVQRLLKDAKVISENCNVEVSKEEMVSRANFLSNVIHGNKTMSSFELVRGYSSSITGLPPSKGSEELHEVRQKQIAKRSLRALSKIRAPHLLKRDSLHPDDKVYFFKRGMKLGKWELEYIREATKHMVILSEANNNRGRPIRAVYEDIRVVPRSSLLRELDEMEYTCPRSYRIVDEEIEVPEKSRDFDRIKVETDQRQNFRAEWIHKDPLPALYKVKGSFECPELCEAEEALRIFETEKALWVNHQRLSPTKLCSSPLREINKSMLSRIRSLQRNHRGYVKDISEPHQPLQPEKHIRDISISAPFPCTLPSPEHPC